MPSDAAEFAAGGRSCPAPRRHAAPRTSICRKRFAFPEVLVRALLRPKAEQLRIGIVADIAAVTVMTKATASSVQMHEAAGAKVPQNTPFGVLLLQLAQFATPANAADQPAAIAETATVPDEAAKNDPKSAAAVPQAGGLAAVLTAATSITSDAQATIQDVPQKAPGARPAVKGDQKKAPDADSNPKIAPDADLVAAELVRWSVQGLPLTVGLGRSAGRSARGI